MATKLVTATDPLDPPSSRPDNLPLHLVLGILFGIILIKSEVVSWFRIQEMFRFQDFHMYGTILSAIAVASLSLLALGHFGARTIRGEPVRLPERSTGIGVAAPVGGVFFGLGWGLLGACPGPIYALIGAGLTVIVVALASALAGTWVYGLLRPHLPH